MFSTLVVLIAMSTRSQLRFTDPDGDTVAQVYRHSDGYPDAIIPFLARLRDVLTEHQWVRGPGYAAAQFVFLDKVERMQWSLEESDDPLDPETWGEEGNYNSFLGGHAVENPADGIHGDEEYLYVVEVPFYRQDESGTGWQVKVSEHGGFPEPQWEAINGELHGKDFDEGETSFDYATWDYEGSLDGAVEKYE